MQEEKIIELLKNKYSDAPIHPYKRKILFWYDDGGAYADLLENIKEKISEYDVKILQITKNKKNRINNIFKLKYTLEHEDKESNYLIYSSEERPKSSENLLIDILLYSEEFIADEPSMIIEEFSFDKNYRDVVKRFKTFFDNKERKKKLKDVLPDKPTVSDIEIGILAVLTNTKVLDIEEILKSIFIKGIEEENEYYENISKFADIELFWGYIEKIFGLTFDTPNVRNLFNTILLIHMYYTIKKQPPLQLDNKAKSKAQSVYVFIEHWMNSIKDRDEFMKLSKSVEKELKISQHIQNIEFEKLVLVNTFRVVDSYILDKISTYILDGLTDYDNYREWINLRRDVSPWNDKIKEIYKALSFSIELLDMSRGFEVRERDVEEIYEAYLKKYYQIDLYYRRFYENYDKVKMKGIEKLEQLREKIEKLYINKLQSDIMKYWDNSLETIKNNWKLINYKNQHEFYNNYISAKKERVFVIVSDGLRYEVATELMQNLSSRIESNKIDLETMFGNAPSYTRLGMASLLPHNNEIELVNGEIKVKDIPVPDREKREKILIQENTNSVALQFEDIKKLGRNEIREVCKGKEVIYIYHNVIDKVGDERATEINVFEACRDTINELVEGVKFLTNTLSASNILITADHGFIYQRESLENYDKLEAKDIATIGSPTKRFIYLGKDIEKNGTILINMDYLFKNKGIKAIIPKQNLRFKLPGGGINYVHGGASLQEIVIPVIKYKNVRNNKIETTKVSVEFISLSRKIRNNVSKFKFVQVEAVNEIEKVLGRVIKIGLYDGINPISNEKQVSINSKENSTEIEISLTLKAMEFEKNKDYYLKVIDVDSNEILFDEKYRIDIGITNDFEF